MTAPDATRFPFLERSPLASVDALKAFLTEASLARSVTALLAGAILLLLVVNFSTYVLIQRTADYNDQVEATWQMRRAARSLSLNVQAAETAQRGYLLTGQSGFLRSYDIAKGDAPSLLGIFAGLTQGDAVGAAALNRLQRISTAKYAEMDEVLQAARSGRIGEAVSLVRAGRGQQLSEDLERELALLDDHYGRRLAEGRERSEGSAVVTVAVNAAAGLIILVLAAIVVVLVRRYLAELNQARAEVDAVNAGLEQTVKDRTGALIRANEEVQRFAYIVSHDLRSPLVNVMGYTSELEQAGKVMDRAIADAEKTRAVDPEVVTAVREDMPEAIGFIRASTEKMDRLINAILKLSREGRRNLVPEPLDMKAMVSRIADSVNHQTIEAGAQIVVEDMATFESDRLSVEQIMGNLIDNAVKYLEPSRPGVITVGGHDLPGGWVEYTVADNGRGIAPRDHERIFELFRRSGRQDRPGEGLGLAFVRNSVRRLGGSIDVDSELGKGSTFRLKFPKRLILSDAGDLS